MANTHMHARQCDLIEDRVVGCEAIRHYRVWKVASGLEVKIGVFFKLLLRSFLFIDKEFDFISCGPKADLCFSFP